MRSITVALFVSGCLLASDAAPATITIDSLEDVAFGSVPPTTRGIRERMRFCVSSNPAGPFRLIAQGTGQGGAFAITNGAGEAIVYRVRLGRSAGQRGQRVRAGIPVTNLNARTPHPTGRCRNPLFLTVRVPRAEITGAPGGEYQGQLAITVAPE